jgi:hypothetical protein
MEGFITGLIGFLADNPAFLTLLVGFALGFFVAKR